MSAFDIALERRFTDGDEISTLGALHTRLILAGSLL